MDQLEADKHRAQNVIQYVQILAVVDKSTKMSFRGFLPRPFRNPSALRVFEKDTLRLAVVQAAVSETRG